MAIKWIPPTIPANLNGHDYSYRNVVKGVLGDIKEEQHICVVDKVVTVSQSTKRDCTFIDWLAVVGGVSLLTFGVWMMVQGIKGVMKSEIQSEQFYSRNVV